ncbi:MAG: hypothetical protein V7K67_20725 [Nostoc sp.]|uniref:hypothetical protein n=1 Tax=Nostoc sp. TaxID=1180 RepID=UPI002FF522F5
MNFDSHKENKGNILLVDDLPENLQLLSDSLIQFGYTVRSVTSGRMALKTVKVKQPDIVNVHRIYPATVKNKYT